jgi:hypothetical protein
LQVEELACALELANVLFVRWLSFFMLYSKLSVLMSFTLGGNVFGLGEGGDFHHKC